MFRKLCLQFILALLLGFNLGPVGPVLAFEDPGKHEDFSVLAAATRSVPDGFEPVLSAPAVTLYRKNYPNGTPDYVQVVLLNQGAAVDLLHGIIDHERPERGVYGGYDARFNLDSMNGFWRYAEKESESAFCVVNGSFFYMPETPTRLPFALKVDGKVLTDGFGEDQYPDQKLMLELWEDRADIRPLSGADLYQSTAPDIIAGLTEEANKRAKYAVGRTFVGIQDQDSDGQFETLYILSTQTHTQSGAAKVLKDFGAEKVMMLDGGGSTQLVCNGEEYIATGRLIPQAIAVFSALPGGLEATLIEAPVKLTSGKDEIIYQEWTLLNSGDLPWLPGEHRLVLEAGPYWAEQQFSPEETVQPGQKLQFSWELSPFSQPGTYPLSLNWYITGAGRQSETWRHEQELIIFSEDSTLQSSELSSQTEWGNSQALQSQSSGEPASLALSGQAEKISLRGMLIVPAIILPLGLLLFAFFRWLRSYSV